MRTLCLGEALVDLICERPVSSLGEADAFVPHFGGATANVAVTAARYGGHVELAGGAGDDPWGAWLREKLEREGVGLRFFRLVGGVATALAFVIVDDEGEPSYLVYGNDIAVAVEALEAHADDAVDACDALFFGSNALVGVTERELTLRARERALEQGKPVVFDPNFRLHRWDTAGAAAAEARACVPHAFLVKCNRREAFLLSGEDDPEAAAAGLLAAGARHVVITLGEHGAMLRGPGLKRDVRGRPAAVRRSAAGAGDAFAGVLLARLGGTDFYPAAIAAALPDAVDEAARAVERWGAL